MKFLTGGVKKGDFFRFLHLFGHVKTPLFMAVHSSSSRHRFQLVHGLSEDLSHLGAVVAIQDGQHLFHGISAIVSSGSMPANTMMFY